jgi:hypothetical protein
MQTAQHASAGGQAMMPSRQAGDDERPPFPLNRPTSASWREQALSKIAELRFVLDWLPPSPARDRAAVTINDHLAAAAAAAKARAAWPPPNILAAMSGSGVDRVISHLDAVETELLRIAPLDYLRGQLPSLVAHVQLHLDRRDPRRARLEAIADRADAHEETERELAAGGSRDGTTAPGRAGALRRGRGRNGARPAPRAAHKAHLDESDREAIIAAVRAASSESRWKVARLRSFRNLLGVTSLVLALGAIGMGVVGWVTPRAIPLCFTPANVVCPTSTTSVDQAQQQSATGAQTARSQAATDRAMRTAASGWDITAVELVGLLAAAIAAAAAIRKVEGTSTPYGLPVAVAVLKLPTGALTALLGLLLMRGGFVPGLSALDSSAQILAWAIVFGYAQQLFTQFVDSQAQTVLQGAAGSGGQLGAEPAGPSGSRHAPPRAHEAPAARPA